MDETTMNTMPAEDHVPAVRLGPTLREKRLAMGLSVADVAAQIRLAPRQIEALEADDLAHLPELPFVRGFVRSYAKLLQLDDQPLLATLPDPHAVSERIEPESVEVPFNVQQLSSRQNRIWLYASALIALLAAGFALWHFSSPKPEVQAPLSDITASSISLPALEAVVSAVPASDVVATDEDAAASAVPPAQSAAKNAAPAAQPPATLASKSAAPVPVAAPVTPPVPQNRLKPAVTSSTSALPDAVPEKPAAPVNMVRIRVVFDAASWTEIKDANGRLMSSRLNESGTELNLNGPAPYELVIGNARFVQLYRRGKLVDLTPYINATSEVARLTLE